jgi:hypothetical protein
MVKKVSSHLRIFAPFTVLLFLFLLLFKQYQRLQLLDALLSTVLEGFAAPAAFTNAASSISDLFNTFVVCELLWISSFLQLSLLLPRLLSLGAL